MTQQRHEFLIDANGGLSRAARQMPIVREYINSLPETAATFRLSGDDEMLDDVQGQFFEDIHLEFLKAWPVHKMYASSKQRGKRYVNPHYVHSHTYSDVVVECACGATFTRNYDDGENALQQAHKHSEDCLPFYRLRARGEMLERRYENMLHLGWLGWKGTDMAPRFGSKKDYMGSLARDFNLNLRECYNEYRQAAARTYKHLVVNHDVAVSEVAEVYDHAPSTMTRWAQKYTDYTTSVGRNANS